METPVERHDDNEEVEDDEGPSTLHVPQWLSAEQCDAIEHTFLTTVPLYRPMYTSRRHGNACTTPCYCAFYARDVHGGIPAWLDALGQSLATRLGMPADYFNCVIGRLYKDGDDHIEWHTDLRRNLDAPDLTIGSISLGPQARTFSMRRVARLWSLARKGTPGARAVAPRHTWRHWKLARGDAFAMLGRRTQHDYEHAVLRDRTARTWRINLNFRHIRADHYDEGCYRFYRYTVHGDNHPHVNTHLHDPADRHATPAQRPHLFPPHSTLGAHIIQPNPRQSTLHAWVVSK